MRKIILLIVTFLACPVLYGQTVAELYNNRDYKALTKLENDAELLSAEELYMVGFAFFQFENDEKAVQFYDRAITNGFDNGPVHFYKGLSLTYMKKYDAALKEVDLALEKEPTNQEYMNQKGIIYKNEGLEDKALDYFEAATRFPNTYGEPYFWVAYIYHGKQDLEKALRAYYLAAEKVPRQNSRYVATLRCIGQLEYTFTQNYQKAAKAYAEAVALEPKDYEYYPKLIKAYNAAREYSKADGIFDMMKAAYKNKELPEAEMKFKDVAVDEYEWNKQKLTVYKSLEDPKNVLDISYKVYLLNKAGDKVERKFTVEKTILVAGGQKHSLCEEKLDSHLTYPYGWKTNTISLQELKEAIGLILDGKIQKMATSYDK